MQEKRFQPLLFGGDINVYSVARAFHEEYGIKSIVYGKYPAFPCHESQIIDYRVCPENESAAAFLANVAQVCSEFPDKKIIVLGCGDSYVKLIAAHLAQLPSQVIAPYIRAQLLDELVDKERFYQLCDKYEIDHPATFVYRRELGENFTLPWQPPYIAKPADSVAYWGCGEPSLAKVYLCRTWEELLESLSQVYAAGYQGAMILQEFIAGDDTNMRVLTNYSDRNARVTLMCLGHVLLEEHSPHGIGNHAVIVSEHNPDLAQKLRLMLEDLHYVGFSNFDIKYDPRDGSYKVFEINCRQGRSNYYVTAAGHNVARQVVEDRIEQRNAQLVITKDKALWRTVPRQVVFSFIPKAYHKQLRTLIAAGNDAHALEYKKDAAPARRLRILKNHLGNLKRFHKYNKKPR